MRTAAWTIGASGRRRAPTVVASTNVVSMQLLSAAGGASVPFCVGHAFRKGDVPNHATLGADTAVQITPLNSWPDGSLKFAVIAGRKALSAGVAATLQLSNGGLRASGANLTTSDLQATGITVSASCGAFGSVSWSGADWATPFAEIVAGPEMSSWSYRKAVGADAHLVVWLEVRLWAGGSVEVLPWIENGYVSVAGVTNKSATYSFDLGGTQRFSAAIDLPNHCRTPLLSGTAFAHWLGSDPGVRPIHDRAYLQATRLVPTYRAVLPGGAAVLSGLSTSFTPLAQANHATTMGSAGYHGSIGPMPEWDVAYLASPDSRGWAAVNVNAYAMGRYGIHYRDQATNRPLRFSQHPNLALSNGNHGVVSYGTSSTNTFTPVAAGTTPPQWANSHHPCPGWMAYLLTGRRYHAETLQFAAGLNFIKNTDTSRQFAAGIMRTDVGANTPRGAAWSLRTLVRAAMATPDSDPLRAEYVASLESNVSYYHAKYVAQTHNPFGHLAPYEDYNTGDSIFTSASWQNDFNVFAWGHIADAEVVQAASQTQLDAFFAWLAQSIVGRLGGTAANEYLYRDAALYEVPMSTSTSPNFDNGTGPWHASWGAIYTAANGVPNPGITGDLRGGNFPESTSYWGNLQPAIAYAVDRGASGALAAYNRMVSAANWATLEADMNINPVWSVRPRSV